jgi:hypothetical protein
MPQVVDALADPAVRQRFADLGMEMPPREREMPQALRDFTRLKLRNGGQSSRPRA